MSRAKHYSVKHEIFLTDVNNCFVHLKKVVQEMHALGALSEAQLQMGQPSVRFVFPAIKEVSD